MKDYTKLYATIFWISLLSILLWLILKALGYINTPPLVELFPLFSAVFGAGAFFQMVMDMKYRLGKVELQLKYHEKRISNLEQP
ncbi:MAG: hypothetical protein WC595_01190 [Candidatus Nanoarchaeia archaeon]